jgi:hypothetical protein
MMIRRTNYSVVKMASYGKFLQFQECKILGIHMMNRYKIVLEVH